MPKLPKDIHPESGNRLPLIKRDDLDEYGKKVWDKQFGTSIAGTKGPGGIAMRSPKIAEAEKLRSRYLATESEIESKLRELAELVGQREMNAQYQWSLHEVEGLREGLSQKTVDVVKYRKSVAGLPEKEAAIIQLGREAFRRDKVSSKTFANALKLFGPRGMVDLVTLFSISASIALRIRVFDLQMGDRKPLLPMP
jgi:4-carboxymuconolactone decarboxylase